MNCVGFVGLGRLGEPASRRLHAAGFPLALYDRDRALAARLAAEYGAQAPETLAALGEQCGIVVTALPDGNAVRETALALKLRPESILLDMSTSSPLDTQALARTGLRVVDAPVSGGVRAAKSGELVFMVGGDAADVERCRPLLQAMGRRIFVAGGTGAGHALKAINNYIAAAGYVACCEGLMAGRRFGLDPQTMLDAINESSGMSYNTQGKFAQHVLPRTWGSGFGLELMAKDVRIALALGAATGTPFPLGERCAELWAQAAAALGEGRDHTEYVRMLEAATGSRL
jgi:3-hydroxyisobutyrate dehydrogenase